MTRISRCCLCGAFIFVLTGCARETIIPVVGRVLFDDQPLTFGMVIFTPDASRGNTSRHEPRGKLDANGVYQAYQTKDQPGLAPGWYKISISAQRMKDPNDSYSYESVIPTRFANPETSGLALEVVANAAPGAYDITLSSKNP
jgi:hypothetical protein